LQAQLPTVWVKKIYKTKVASQLQHQGTGNVDAVIQMDQEEPLPSDFNIPVDNAEEEKPKQVLRSTIPSSTILSFFFDNSRIGRF
jgi:hypothetical protein